MTAEEVAAQLEPLTDEEVAQVVALLTLVRPPGKAEGGGS